MSPNPLGILLILVTALAAPVAAHGGFGGGFAADGTLEGESYDVAEPDCDPDFDGEHTRPVADATASAGWYAFLPSSGCAVTFEDVDFAAPAFFDSVRVLRNDAVAAFVVVVTVDGEPHAVGSYDGGAQPAWIDVPLASPLAVQAGTHDVRVSYSVAGFWSWQNLYLDRLHATFVG